MLGWKAGSATTSRLDRVLKFARILVSLRGMTRVLEASCPGKYAPKRLRSKRRAVRRQNRSSVRKNQHLIQTARKHQPCLCLPESTRRASQITSPAGPVGLGTLISFSESGHNQYQGEVILISSTLTVFPLSSSTRTSPVPGA